MQATAEKSRTKRIHTMSEIEKMDKKYHNIQKKRRGVPVFLFQKFST